MGAFHAFQIVQIIPNHVKRLTSSDFWLSLNTFSNVSLFFGLLDTRMQLPSE